MLTNSELIEKLRAEIKDIKKSIDTVELASRQCNLTLETLAVLLRAGGVKLQDDLQTYLNKLIAVYSELFEVEIKE